MRYYVDGKQITAEQAKEIEKRNNEYLNSGNMSDLMKIKFIVAI